MQVVDRLYAFIWDSMTINNCNTYFIDGPTRILIDPGHANHFSHVEDQLSNLDLAIDDIGLVICTHAHPDHLEAAAICKKTGALVAMHKADWKMVKSMFGSLNSPMESKLGSIEPDFFIKGSGTITSKLNKIKIKNASQGEVVIKYHWLETLSALPAVPMERYEIEGSPIGFIKIINDKIQDIDIYNTYNTNDSGSNLIFDKMGNQIDLFKLSYGNHIK